MEEETQQSLGDDTILLSCGYALTFLYFAAFLGKFNLKENKVCMQLLRVQLYYSFLFYSALGCSIGNHVHRVYLTGNCWSGQLHAASLWPSSFYHTILITRLL